jgi:hypothetical protein
MGEKKKTSLQPRTDERKKEECCGVLLLDDVGVEGDGEANNKDMHMTIPQPLTILPKHTDRQAQAQDFEKCSPHAALARPSTPPPAG